MFPIQWTKYFTKQGKTKTGSAEIFAKPHGNAIAVNLPHNHLVAVHNRTMIVYSKAQPMIHSVNDISSYITFLFNNTIL